MNKYTIEVKDVKHLHAIQGAIEHILVVIMRR